MNRSAATLGLPPLPRSSASCAEDRGTGAAKESDETLRIGEMAETTGVSERLLRYYESRGLLTPGRSATGHRVYTRADVARVRLVRFLLDGGMSTKDIRFLLECVHEGVDVARVCPELDSVLTREFVRISKEIESLALTRSYLAVLTGRPLADGDLAVSVGQESAPAAARLP
ncbi:MULTISPECIES: MerR family transcriptional regulator [Streptomyces]|uniref:MerR family transcriptional regulator n=1 Tax=Streptomyces TaxID=1883 RepID=UPI001E4DCD8E|nr:MULTISPECIES: MerR family transcriptional regulator [Streptomyces]UFQ18990.1 MerR family transcriptional regulator [Streptomyces huasconensis]WCL88609.1 MerR family transcriptional regulator [Streptomyces sp. JCM 35825]